jgi:hypothetical protein
VDLYGGDYLYKAYEPEDKEKKNHDAYIPIIHRSELAILLHLK